MPPNPPRTQRPAARPESFADPDPDPDDEGLGDAAARLGERTRRLAMGLTAALLTARVYTTGEPDLEQGAGAGLIWVLALMIVGGLAIASGLIGGRFRFRWSWADAAVVALMVLVAMSSRHAMDRRPALNLAWEWVAMGVGYLLLRNLPRTRGESSAIAGAMVATAFAVAVYGLYQGWVELPALREQFKRNPGPILAQMGIAPGTQSAARFADRLAGSNEILSTFALANSLAGFLVGPLVLMLGVWIENLADRDERSSRGPALFAAAAVILVLLIGLMLTKSRSAYIGLIVGVAILAWRSRRRVPPRLLIGVGAGGLVVVAAMIAIGLATKRLDVQVLTESSMSLRIRWQYWRATWAVIAGGALKPWLATRSPVFWSGVGPGNFRAAYLRYKLPESSEEILDPHDLFLEVWATAGIWALLALVLALAVGLWEILGPSRGGAMATTEPDENGDAPPRGERWLIASAWAGGILVVLLGMMNLFGEGAFIRWLILGSSWVAAALLIGPLWRCRPIPASAMGAAVAAIVVNLLAAGGIGIPTVAMGLWATLAIGLNLRDDRPCGRLRERPTRIPSFVLSTVWAAAVGLFLGAVVPFWRAEAAIAQAEDAMRRQPPNFDAAESAYKRAIVADRYYVRPWLGYADLAFRAWEWRGAKAADERWEMIPELLEKAVSAPRNPLAWTLHLRRAEVIRQLVRLVGQDLKPVDDIRYKGQIVKELRTASRLYPSNAMLHARLAEASATISMGGDAVDEAEEALRLDDLKPIRDRQLSQGDRERLLGIVAEAKKSEKP